VRTVTILEHIAITLKPIMGRCLFRIQGAFIQGASYGGRCPGGGCLGGECLTFVTVSFFNFRVGFYHRMLVTIAQREFSRRQEKLKN